MESLRRNSYNSFGESLNNLGVGKSLASLGVVGKSPSSVDLGWGGWTPSRFCEAINTFVIVWVWIDIEFAIDFGFEFVS